MPTIHLEHEGRSARVGLNAPPAEKVAAPLEQVTSTGKVKRVQALNGQNPLASATSAQLAMGIPSWISRPPAGSCAMPPQSIWIRRRPSR